MEFVDFIRTARYMRKRYGLEAALRYMAAVKENPESFNAFFWRE